MSNRLNPDQAQPSAGTNLGPNSLQSHQQTTQGDKELRHKEAEKKGCKRFVISDILLTSFNLYH